MISLSLENRQGAATYITESGKKITKIPSEKIPKLYRVATYCRVSTLRDAQLESLQAQKEYYHDYVKRRLDWVLVREYVDVKSARSIQARDQFVQMIADCMDGNIDIIVTKTISRFGRNTVDTFV